MKRILMDVKTHINVADTLVPLGSNILNWGIVGSTLICGEGHDIDVLCLVKDTKSIEQHGFVRDLDEDVLYESNFVSFRKDDFNVLATTNPQYFMSEITIATAASIIAHNDFDMTLRDDRVAFHGELRRSVAPYVIACGDDT